MKSKLTQKLISAYSVLYYYHLIDNTKGKSLEEVPENIRNEVEILANERFTNEYLKRVEIKVAERRIEMLKTSNKEGDSIEY